VTATPIDIRSVTEFEAFSSIPRLSRECVVTEKIDGTNAQILITDDGGIVAGSRSRWISPADDNFGFARWAEEHADELIAGLGPGRHFGEWWGAGIQRRYGLTEKRFSLFNVSRWGDDAQARNPLLTPRPACCHVVPVLYRGLFKTEAVDMALGMLDVTGSQAAPGFMNPEGIVIWHEAARVLFKKTIGDDGHKGQRAREAQS
jgi:hypothetical protein